MNIGTLNIEIATNIARIQADMQSAKQAVTSSMGEIEKAIHKAGIGVQPTNDGNVIRLPFPALTEDRRKEIAKGIKKIGEDAKVAIRNARRDANEEIKKQEKDKKISEDERKKLEVDIQKHTDTFVKMVDDKLAAKEKEVMTI